MQLGRWRSAAAVVGAALTLLAGPAALRAQGTITGRVTQDGGRPLADARVLAIGTSLSAATNDSGKFTLKNAPVGTVQLQVLRVGFQSLKKSVTVTSGETVNADFVLPIAVAQLEEVVTTATGQQRKVELGNAVSTLGNVTKRVEETPNHNLSDLLIAKSPGVTFAAARANRLYLERYRDNGKIMGVIEEVSRYDAVVNEARMQRQKHFAERAEASVRRLQAQGLADLHIDPEIAAVALGAMIARFAELWIVEDWADYPFDHATDQVTRLWANAIGLPTDTVAPRKSRPPAKSNRKKS